MKIIKLTKRIIIDKDSTIIRQGGGDQTQINNRIQFIKTLIKQSKSDYDTQKNKQRLAKLTDGVAVIKVGAATQAQLVQKKARIDDSLHATRAAIEQGIVPGGGRVFIRAIEQLVVQDQANKEQMIAVQILKKALQMPLKKIAENAGDSGEVIVERIKQQNDINI